MSILGKLQCFFTKRHVWSRPITLGGSDWVIYKGADYGAGDRIKTCERCGLVQKVKRRAKKVDALTDANTTRYLGQK